MTTPSLAKIERVDLREAWPNEARDFTPWLAENIAELGEALGMDLELQETEASVGVYSLDVLATDRNQNRPVIIENQLETTNHDHLGKLLTYAAGYDANVIVWLTREFRDEHLQALDWLNQRTSEETQFFGVVVELWRIGESLPAPHFKAVATPNEWRKRTIRRGRAETISDSVSAGRHQHFFQPVIDDLHSKGIEPIDKGQHGNWYAFDAGCGEQARYRLMLSNGTKPRVAVYFDGPQAERNEKNLKNLEENKHQIEDIVGGQLDWSWDDTKRRCWIALDHPNGIDVTAENPLAIQIWMIQNFLRYKSAFGPHLPKLVNQIPQTQEQPTIE